MDFFFSLSHGSVFPPSVQNRCILLLSSCREPHMKTRELLCAMMVVIGAQALIAQSQNEHWVATWTTAERAAPPVVSPAVGQPFTAAMQAQLGFNNQTIRMIAPVSIGGRRVRVQLSNAYGTTPLKLG